MKTHLTLEDIDDVYTSKIYRQEYSDKDITIDGVKLFPIASHLGEDGAFSEVLRINDAGRLVIAPQFKLRQANRTELAIGSIKAWHLHYKQQEIWYVFPQATVLVGLLDLRKNSPTMGTVLRLMLGGERSQLLLIPAGVAHGSANFSSTSTVIWYFIDQLFDKESPDEYRMHWDILGKDFWIPQRD